MAKRTAKEQSKTGSPYKRSNTMIKWKCPECQGNQIKTIYPRLIQRFVCIHCDNLENMSFLLGDN